MKAAGIEVFGVADYNETLPGTGFKQREMFDGIQSVIVCLIPWDTGMNEGRNMARYAVGRNYHDVAAEHLSVATEILRRASLVPHPISEIYSLHLPTRLDKK